MLARQNLRSQLHNANGYAFDDVFFNSLKGRDKHAPPTILRKKYLSYLDSLEDEDFMETFLRVFPLARNDYA
jgi:hypothetical protein